MARTAEDVRVLSAPIADRMGLELVDVECKGPDKRRFVRLLIHRPGGVSAEDCNQFAHELKGEFDEQEFFFPGVYNLEVASPGLDRPLRSARDFTRNLGQKVRVFLTEPRDGKVEWVGRIADVIDERLHLALDGEARKDFGLHNVSRGKLVIDF